MKKYAVLFVLSFFISYGKLVGQDKEVDVLPSNNWEDSLKFGMNLLNAGEYEKAAEIGFHILQEAEESGQNKYMARSAFLLGEIYRLRKDGEKSVMYQGQATRLYRELGDTLRICMSQHNLGLCLDL